MAVRVLDPDSEWQYLHVVFKSCERGHKSDPWIFCNRVKSHFIEQLFRFLKLYKPIELLGYVQLGSHGHCLFAIPKSHDVTLKQTSECYQECYGKAMDARSHRCHILRAQLNNVSKFVQRFERDFTIWFNGHCGFERKGSLWNPRFHSTLLCDAKALISCWRYIQFNPVKAKMENHPKDYEYSTLGTSDCEKREECLQNLFKHYKRMVPGFQTITTFDQFLKLLEQVVEEEYARFRQLGCDKYHANTRIFNNRAVGEEGGIKELMKKKFKRKHSPPHEQDGLFSF